MLGVPVVGPTTMYGDNMSVILNTTVPSSQLKKKHNAIAYHRVREAIAAKILTLQHIPSTENIADVLTKPLPVNTFYHLLEPVLFREQPNATIIEAFDVTTTGEQPIPVTDLQPDKATPEGEAAIGTQRQPGTPGEHPQTLERPEQYETATLASRALHVALNIPPSA